MNNDDEIQLYAPRSTADALVRFYADQAIRQPIIPIPATPATPISIDQIATIERMNRVQAVTSVLHAEATIAKTWLNYRYPGEKNIRIDYTAASKGGRGCGGAEYLRATLEVNIS